jgi:precorrin-3B synthase
LLRVPLVGGLLDPSQVTCLAEVARYSKNGIVELTNRGNLQLRGLNRQALPTALDACRTVGLGDADASLVTISPFAGPSEHGLRSTLVRGLANLDLERLSRKFVVHVDDAEGTTADRLADLSLRLIDGRCEAMVRTLGSTTCGSTAEATRLARCLADRCVQHGPQTRAADLVASEGPAAEAIALGATQAWRPPKPAPRTVPPAVGVTVLPTATARPRGGGAADETHVALAAACFGRVNAATLGAIAHLLGRHHLETVRVTPRRTFAFFCTSAAQAAAVLADAASIGLLTDVQDPAVGVIACIGAAGCWQTQLDTLGEAERFVASRPAEMKPGALVHVSGCDKFCATRAPVALTLLGRTDQTGFDALGAHEQ